MGGAKKIVDIPGNDDISSTERGKKWKIIDSKIKLAGKYVCSQKGRDVLFCFCSLHLIWSNKTATSHNLGPQKVAEEGKNPYLREI